jgi:hypothetical protein
MPTSAYFFVIQFSFAATNFPRATPLVADLSFHPNNLFGAARWRFEVVISSVGGYSATL